MDNNKVNSTAFVEWFECNSDISFAELCGDSKRYEGIFEGLLDGKETEFFLRCWEKKPGIFKRSKSVMQDRPSLLFSKKYMLSTVERFQLESEHNFNIVKYDGDRKNGFEVPHDERGSHYHLSKAFKNGYTVQFFQPQRFSDYLYRLNASFENKFGTLAGASAYLTPSDTQGLAPHHDDVEVFIIQLEGTKLWNLWDSSFFPSDGSEDSPHLPLPETYSHDLDRNRLPSTTPPSKLCQQILLEEGDILYLPRGVIHEAVAQSEFSTHVTVSVYQHYNYKRIISHMMQPLLESAFKAHMPLRTGLPISLHTFSGSGAASFLAEGIPKEDNDGEKLKSNLGSKRSEFLATVKEIVARVPEFLTDSIIDTAADELASDFMSNRLPPPNLALPTRRSLIPNSYEGKSGSKSKPQRDIEDETTDNKILLRELDNSFDKWKYQLSCDSNWNSEIAPNLLAIANPPEKKLSKKKFRKSESREIKDIEVKMCSLNSMHIEVINIDGEAMLALTSSRFNSRLRHMGLNVPSLIDDSTYAEENEEDDEESSAGDDESSSADRCSIGEMFDKMQQNKRRRLESPEEASLASSISQESCSLSAPENSLVPWTIVLPLKYRPLVWSLLYHCEMNGAISLTDLLKEMNAKHGIESNEAVQVILELCAGGLIATVNKDPVIHCL